MNIRVHRRSGVIEKMNIEEYLRGVVPSEIGREAPFEAMKAQAIASRTFALRHIITDKSKEYDVVDTVSNQVYNPDKICDQADEAIKATEGIVMVYNGSPIGGWFSSSNGGRIKAAHEKWGGSPLPYSVAKDDPYDTYGGGGHGVGMSQRGAMAMADQGFTYQQILEFYYNDAFQFRQIGEVYMRTLRKGSKGEEVKILQNRLIKLGYELPKYGADGDFGNETYAAVKEFQSEHLDSNRKKLTVDGIVGKKTWEALFAANVPEEEVKEEPKEEPVICTDLPENIGATAAKAISADLDDVSDLRKQIVLTALRLAYDPEVPCEFPRSLYIWGANLYEGGKPNVMNDAALTKAFTKYPKKFTTKSRAMMRLAVIKNPGITGSDCSGGIVGLLRHFGLVKSTFDTNANGFCGSSHSKSIKKADLKPGDWVGMSGHIGLYVGGGYVVEWYGQDYGAQLTKLGTRRKAWNFVEKKFKTKNEWTKYRRPKYY